MSPTEPAATDSSGWREFDPQRPSDSADAPPVGETVWVWNERGGLAEMAWYHPASRAWVDGETRRAVYGTWWQPIVAPERPDALLSTRAPRGAQEGPHGPYPNENAPK